MWLLAKVINAYTSFNHTFKARMGQLSPSVLMQEHGQYCAAVQCCSWMFIWFLRKRGCHLCGTRHSVTPMVWGCRWLHIFAQCKQQTADMRVCIYLRVCMYYIVDANWQRPAIVPPMVYLHLTQAGAWCEMWFICAMLRPVLWRQRYLLSYPQHCIIYWPPALPTALWLCY